MEWHVIQSLLQDLFWYVPSLQYLYHVLKANIFFKKEKCVYYT